ncbi:MAG: DUF763 domain-containing protein [Candidatus Bathyarchaeota archaeon]|nr:DUF763 domain-containing protein [Candidatus Bathyarchaeota archaeon]
MMYRSGVANLPLHGGKAPAWLTGRMRKLAHEIAGIMVEEYGPDELLRHLSDPYWFQALGCVLAYDWHSSGVTTVVTGILKNALSAETHGIVVCGGKGKTSRKTPSDIEAAAQKFDFCEETQKQLTYNSRMAAKVDNSAIQAGYQLYHHAFLVTRDGKWAVIQQGMSDEARMARRYHWLSDNTSNFVVEPHNAIVGTKHTKALNMVAATSESARKASVDLAKEPTQKLRRLIESAARAPNQASLQTWLPPSDDPWQQTLNSLNMPRNINWDTLTRVYDFQPQNYEELLSLQGVGPATVRGLALVAELIYGEEPCWEDPVKFSFAYGGKDGVPFPVNRKAMDESIQILRNSVEAARIGETEKLQSLQRLRRYVPA